MTSRCDLLIIGGGPAGLSAAINAASEGLNVRLMDNGTLLGGQAKESSAIENYPGFPEGIDGWSLMGRLVKQARKFHTEMINPQHAGSLSVSIEDKCFRVLADDYSETLARSVLLALGLSYRRLNAENIGEYMGRGVWYGVPANSRFRKGQTVAVIGGANSAGQAAMALAGKNCQVYLLVRSTITKQMSQYLIDRITDCDNVTVLEGCELEGCHGSDYLSRIDTNQGTIDATGVYIFIGAVPKTLWLQNTIELDRRGFVMTAPDLSQGLPYETSMQGVFAAGDVRFGSTKRIATAIGEGAGALQMIHRHLGRRS